ncbi:unnamed protein product [Effrenium voratum]|uniref:Kinesin motor domain-containing protein n=1 Tax=Effrenium voratum TaxID=2562239 RepID=A0AA36JK89_9DINO|nr:unnamed protein product [Effrenium voratum]
MSVENIHVAIRIRPMSESEDQVSRCAVCVPTAQPTVVVQASDGQIKSFTYDHCFSSLEVSNDQGTQEKVYSEIGADLVTSALEGYNCCLFAYGQTGAGKSHTMMGYGDQPGVIPRAVEDLFEQKARVARDGDELRVWASFVEIYNETLRDLLEPSSLVKDQQSTLRIMDHPALGVIIPGLVEAACQTALEVRKLIKFGLKKRVTSATIMNNTSSRSHAVFILKVQRLPRGERSEALNARMNLVDLAGSERHKHMDSQGATFKEGCAINQSLSALALVIKELGEQQARSFNRQRTRTFSGPLSLGPANGSPVPESNKEAVPFRASKLTFLLRDSLAGNSRSRMVAAISPAAINVDETISTLRFASSVKQVKTNASVNVDQKTGVVQHLQAEVRRLKALLAARGVEVNALGAGSVQEEIADRERVLKTLRQSYTVQLEEAQLLASARQEALNQQGLSSEDVDEVFGLEKNTPHLLNMSDDPVLSGCLVYFLPKGQVTKMGSHPDNDIVIKGLGINDFLCSFENPDQRQVYIRQASAATGEKARVLVNGQAMKRGERRQLQHFDRLILGRAWMMKLVVPLEHQELAANKSPDEENSENSSDSEAPVVKKRSLLKHDTMKLIITDESEAWSELRLYLGDLWERLGEERGNQFFYNLSKAAQLVDEANDITKELRPEDRLKFEVELVWDIHRHVSDIIIIRITQWSATMEASVLSYWTVDSFKRRLESMRDCYDSWCSQGLWTGKGDPLEDPWLDPSTVELTLQMHKSVEEQLRREEMRHSLGSKLEELRHGGIGESPVSGPRSRRESPTVSRQSSKRLNERMSTAGSSRQSSKRLAPSGKSSLAGRAEGSMLGKIAGGDSEQGSRAGSKASCEPPNSARERPPSARDSLRKPKAEDELLARLRQQLKDKADVEAAYKSKIEALQRELEELQKQHGPLQNFISGVATDGAPTRRLSTCPIAISCSGGGQSGVRVHGLALSGVASPRGVEPLARQARQVMPVPTGTSTAPPSPPVPTRMPTPVSGYHTMPLPLGGTWSPRA